MPLSQHETMTELSETPKPSCPDHKSSKIVTQGAPFNPLLRHNVQVIAWV